MLARDRTGIRPLFYTHDRGRLAFASEVKALFTLPGVTRRLDAAGLAGTFSYWAPLAPGSIFEGVSSLPPGHRMVVDDAGTRTECYWDWTFAEQASAVPSEDECAEEVAASFKRNEAVPKPTLETLFTDVYGEMPSHLREQSDFLVKMEGGKVREDTSGAAFPL